MGERDPRPALRLRHFFLGSAAIVLWLLLDGSGQPGAGARVLAYRLAVAPTYALVYLLPAIALTGVARALARLVERRGRVAWGRTLVSAVAVSSASATDLVLLADERVYRLWGFHLNGFVWNLATTRGGLESLGAGASTYRSVALIALAFLGAHAAWMRLCSRPAPARLARWVPGRAAYRAVGALLLVLAVGERVAYGISEVRAYTPILVAADAFPFYTRLTFRSLAERLGLEARREPAPELEASAGRLDYPLAPLQVRRPERPLNVVWLVAESLRADALVPETMPATSAFAVRAVRARATTAAATARAWGCSRCSTGCTGPTGSRSCASGAVRC